MAPFFLGVDLAGSDNTWIAALSKDGDNLQIVLDPQKASLQNIISYCEANDVLGVAIDAQLSMSIDDERGMRSSDMELRGLLPENCQNWVASFNSMMALPIRGRLLGDALSPILGTILETHPRACLRLALGQTFSDAIKGYKFKGKDEEKKAETKKHLWTLWTEWTRRFGISGASPQLTDGAIDAVICATVAFLFHHAPAKLYRLRHLAPAKTGRGPFYVIQPKSE